MKNLKLGILGLSEGNGHPYSWSAIINGYNPAIMAECPFPVIPQYLAQQSFPDAKIKNAEITHIWTQDLTLSQHIAAATYIPHIVEQVEQMIPHIDAVLLARDDAENHIAMAQPFLEAGLPIYIDKPAVLTCKDVELLFSLQQYPGQIFTCSAFQYAKELTIASEIPLNKITRIEARIKNHWNKYAIHLIEPILKIIGHHHTFRCEGVTITATDKTAQYQTESGIKIKIQTFLNDNVKPSIDFFYENSVTTIIFEDVFFAFKAALEKFIAGVRKKQEITKKDFVIRCVEILEAQPK